MASRSYRSVNEMLADLDVDDELKRDARRAVAERQLTDALFAMRSAKGITREDVAKELDAVRPRSPELKRARTER